MQDMDAQERLFQSIAAVIGEAHSHVRRAVNSAMVQAYWQIGQLIVEHEQQGHTRAAYGKQQLNALSRRLTGHFGKGFEVSNLRSMRRFYLAFPIQETVSLELSWSHYNLDRLEADTRLHSKHVLCDSYGFHVLSSAGSLNVPSSLRLSKAGFTKACFLRPYLQETAGTA